jgi:mannose-1-phosphate guanylyltransferase
MSILVPNARPGAPVARDDRQAKPPWAIVLAGGEGRRLRLLTRYVCGDDRPKQFAALLGGRSLLRQTLDRIRPRIPLARTVVVSHVRDAEYVAQEFACGEAPECLLQPEDRGTAAAILWAAHVIRHREPDAVVVVFPSDHYVDGEPEFIGHVLDVVTFVRRREERLVLIGAIPTEAATPHGWIEPGDPIGGIHGEAVYGIARFCEKPSSNVARAFPGAGAFWNTFILVSPVATLATVGAAAVPRLNALLERLAAFSDAPDERWAIRQAFALAPRTSFSRDVLERVPLALAVSPLPPSVFWTDWGTRERVVASLRRAGFRPRWLEALGEPSLPVGATGQRNGAVSTQAPVRSTRSR